MFAEVRVLLFFFNKLEEVVPHLMTVAHVLQRQADMGVEVPMSGEVEPETLGHFVGTVGKRLVNSNPKRLHGVVLVQRTVYVDTPTVNLYMVFARTPHRKNSYRKRANKNNARKQDIAKVNGYCRPEHCY